MSLLQNALARVARKALRDQPLRHQKHVVGPYRNTKPTPAPSRTRAPKVSKSKLRLARSDGSNFRKLIFQSFFKPLNMPLLKIFDNEVSLYDTTRAEANLELKQRKDSEGVLNMYLSEKHTFKKMLDFLIKSTPPHLKDEEIVNSPERLAQVLEKENSQYMANQFPNVPRFSFTEVPPIPDPLTKENFKEYIYTLTRCNFPYRNSSSLTSGIIPEILLYTHHLENDRFKPFRSVDTFNYLIAYFGYNKFQNYFARGLLLVMAKDGHTPNIQTVNELLKICRIHSKRRSLVSSYQVVINYLSLAKRLNIPINLTTWNRVYDCIDNIFFKEAFINKMMLLNLPILENMCIRILTDYCQTCQNTEEVISFVENDLRRPNWRQMPRLADRILNHAIITAKSDKEIQLIMRGLFQEIAIDGLTYHQASWALANNPNIFSPALHLLCMYLSLKVEPLPEMFVALIKGFCSGRSSFNIPKAAFIVRGIIHDASEILKLPLDEIDVEFIPKKDERFPYALPKGGVSERYRMIKRLTQNVLMSMEAAIIHNNFKLDKQTAMPWQTLSEEEVCQWNDLKTALAATQEVHEKVELIARDIALIPASQQPPDEIIHKYERMNFHGMSISTDSRLLHRLQNGFDSEFQKDLKKRGISKQNI